MSSVLQNTSGIFSRFKISHKLWFSFGALVLLLLVVSLTALYSLSGARTKIIEVTGVAQPTVILSMELAETLDGANAALGFYLLSKSEYDKTEYLRLLSLLDKKLEQLQQMPNVKTDTEIQQRVQVIKKGIARYQRYRAQMLELATSFNKNQPGIGFSAGKMEPVAAEIQQNLAQMILAESEESLSEKRRHLFLDINNLRQTWMNIVNANRAFIAFRDKANVENIRLYREGFVKNLKKVQSYTDLLNFEQEDAVSVIAEKMKVYFGLQDRLIKIHSSKKWRMDAYLIATEISPLVETIKKDLNWIVLHQRAISENMAEDLLSQVNMTTKLVAGLLLLGLFIGLGGGSLLTTSITRALNSTVAAMTDIAHGDGDMTQRMSVHGRDELARLSSSFNSFVEKIQNTILHVSSSTATLAVAADKMAAISNDTTQGMQLQRSEIEKVVTAMGEMTITVDDVSQHAESAAGIASRTDEQARDGRKIVETTISSIEKLASRIEQTAVVIHRLDSDSENIGSVLEVINGIAEQTNLLALNAAIEAARAGDQGRGFAVVADEVRNLAARTQSSTGEIRQMIENLQNAAREAVTEMESGRTQVQESVEQAGLAGVALEAITRAVDEISAMNRQIADAAHQQREVTGEINENIININQVADNTSNHTIELAEASKELSELALELQELVGRFKVS